MAVAPVSLGAKTLFSVGSTAVTVSDAFILGSALFGAAGAVSSAQSASYQAKVQQQQAQRERQEAAQREDDFRRLQAKKMGERRALLGGTGVDASSGSPLLTSEDFAGETELQALRIRSGGELRATRLEQQADLTRMQGRGHYLRAGSLLMSGAGKAFGR